MAEPESTGTETVSRRLARKALMPIVATAASAAAGYVAKRGPDIVENTLLPKVKELTSDGRSGVSDLAEGLTDRAKDVVSSPRSGRASSRAEVERHIQQRTEARAARRRAARKG